MNKLKVGWFSFSCCEDSTIIFTEMLNDHYNEWKKIIDFKSALVLQRKEDLTGGLDVAFIEGAITAKEQEEKLKHIRSIAKKVVAIGSCACSGMPSGQRNDFDQQKLSEIEAIIVRLSYAEKVQKISDVVTVDAQVAGCPMSEASFLEVLNKYLVEFGITATQ